MKTSCNKSRNRCHPHHESLQGLGQRGAMERPRALVLLLALLTLCITAGTPEVWVQVQMATRSPSLTVRCGFLGSSIISQVTVNSRAPNSAGGTKLAVLNPEFGTKTWPPAHQAHWETKTSISLTVEESDGRSSSPNTTFCCKFTSFPEGSQEACGNLLLRTDQELPALTPAAILRADLAGILGVSGILLFACIYLLYLLHRQKHRSVMKLQAPLSSLPTQTQARAASQASLASLHIPYATITANYCCPADLDTVLPPQPLSRWAPIPTHTTHPPAPWAPLPASACSSFISVENGLYVQSGEKPPHIRSNFIPFSDPRGPRAKEGHIRVQ